MNKVSSLVILTIVTSGMFVQTNSIFAPSHPEFAGQNTIGLYTKGSIDQSSPFAGQSIRTIIKGDSATVIHPGQGIELVRLDIKPSDACIQTQSMLCFDAIVTSVKNTPLHQIGDELFMTFDLANKKQIVTVNSGPMQGNTVTIDLSKINLQLNGPYTISFTQEGGIAGIQNSITIDTGEAQLTKDSTASLLDEDSVKIITKAIKKAKFFGIEKESYLPIEGSADYFTYSIQITQGVFQKTVSWADTSEDVPDKLLEIKDMIMEIVDASSEQSLDTIPIAIAKEFVMTAPTFAFDGIEDSLEVADVMVLESFPEQFVITISFESLHGGYGDRTDQIVTQVITPHTIVVTVVDEQVISAVIDDKWNELNQESVE